MTYNYYQSDQHKRKLEANSCNLREKEQVGSERTD